MLRILSLAVGLAILWSVGAQAQQLGPSFSCPSSDPLRALICSSPTLARDDLAFVQAYQARRQWVGPAGENRLWQEAVAFDRAVRGRCGLESPLTPAPGAAGCVEQFYRAQQSVWMSGLSGAAAQEAARPLEQHRSLQGALRVLGYLGANEPLDAVYGSNTRGAIVAWQQATGRPQTGLLGDEDAAALAQAAMDRLRPRVQPPPPVFHAPQPQPSVTRPAPEPPTHPVLRPTPPPPTAASSPSGADSGSGSAGAIALLGVGGYLAYRGVRAARRRRTPTASPIKVVPPTAPAKPARPPPAAPVEVFKPTSNARIWACQSCGNNNSDAKQCEICGSRRP